MVTDGNNLSDEFLVEIEGLHFAYGGRVVLKGINLRARRGQVVAIMGASGGGKTTLLRLIGGQLKPTAGHVRVAGQAVNALKRRELYRLRRRMGMLFQFGALFTDMSVFDNVAFQLREHTGLPADAIRDLVLMKLNAVGLRGAADLMPAELSGGMARRAALARAIALDPQLMMYDEPFTGLDPISLAVAGNLIRKLTDTLGMTSLVVTHDVKESFAIADYVYIMADGVIAAEGRPEDIEKSDLPFVRQFVHGEIEGPVAFHLPAPDYAQALGLEQPHV